MKLLSITFFVSSISTTFGFATAFVNPTCRLLCTSSQLSATHAETAERLLRRARELREASQREEDDLHATLIQKKREKDDATDAIIFQLFKSKNDLVQTLREKRLASVMLVRIVERLHEREIAARGLEHVEPSLHHDQVIFKRVAQPDEVELAKIEGTVHQLIAAAEVLDQEFFDQKSVGDKITHAEMIHWGGGHIATILKDKVKELGREQDDQFQARLQSFYEAANRKNHKDHVDGNSWRDEDVWSN